MGLEDMAKKVEDIKEDLKKVKESVLSETKRIEQINYIKYRAEMAKRELESSFNSLKDKAREEGQSLLKSLNEVINFKLSIGDNTPGNSNSRILSSSGNVEKGFFDSAKDWIGEQWSNIRNGDKRKEEGGKNILRTAGFVATGVGAAALAYKGVKKLLNWLFGDDEEEEDETEDIEDTDEEETEDEDIEDEEDTDEEEENEEEEDEEEEEKTKAKKKKKKKKEKESKKKKEKKKKKSS